MMHVLNLSLFNKKNLKTPTMSIPFKPSVSEEDMTLIARKLSKLTLMELIASHKGISITECKCISCLLIMSIDTNNECIITSY